MLFQLSVAVDTVVGAVVVVVAVVDVDVDVAVAIWMQM